MPLETARKAEQNRINQPFQSAMAVDKADSAAVAPSNARSFKNFVGRFLLPMSPVLLSLKNYVLLTPPIFAARFHVRRFYWRLTGHPLKQLVQGAGVDSNFVAEQVLPYNLGNINIINRGRTERIIAILRSIRGVKLHALNALVVGPRNEAELMLLSSYGFDSAKLTAIDLFSYSPAVQLMDMHELKFSENTFDVIYSAFVITYSDDIPKAVSESIRVARDGALIVFVFEHLTAGDGNRFGKNNLPHGPASLLEVFGNHVGHVYWQEDFENESRYTSSVIFRLSKQPVAAQ